MSLNLLKLIAEKQVEFVDFRYTDANNNWLCITYEAKQVSHAVLEGISHSFLAEKITLVPDITTAFIDPFNSLSTLVIICLTSHQYDTRTKLQKTLTFLAQNVQVKQTVSFFIFDEVELKNCPSHSLIKITHTKNPNTLRAIRDEIATTLTSIDLKTLNHYEVEKSKGSINLVATDLLSAADAMQKYKYVIKQVALSYGKTATFMPKALSSSKSTNLTIELILEENGEYFYGGIIKHFRALQAFMHNTNNSYKDHITPPKYINNTIYLNVDALMPCYDGFAAIILAGIDGITNKISPEHLQSCNSLALAINSLEQDLDFLTKYNVFTGEEISSYIHHKKQEIAKLSAAMCALEFKLYYHL